MRRPSGSPQPDWRREFITVGSAAILCLFLCWPPASQAAAPVISLIEPYLTNQVLIHFDVEANTRCILQCTDRFPTNGIPAAAWSNLYAPPKLIFFEHYIVPDMRTNKMRFYRLMITP